MIRPGGRSSGGGGVPPFRAETILKGNGALISFIINNAANAALSKNESGNIRVGMDDPKKSGSEYFFLPHQQSHCYRNNYRKAKDSLKGERFIG